MSYGVGRRRGSDPTLLWLWRGPAAAAPIRPLAWEPPYVAGAALKRQKKKKKRQPLLQYRTTTRFRNPSPGHISRENHNSKRYMQPYVH